MSAWNPHGESRPTAGQRLNLKTPTDRLRALSHRHHAESGLRFVRSSLHAVEADSVVLHGHHAYSVRMIERYFDVPRAGVFCDVVESFLRDAKERNFDLRCRSYSRLASGYRDRDPRSHGEFTCVPVQGRRKTVVVEHRRSQLGHDVLDRVHRRLEKCRRIVHSCPNLAASTRSERRLEDIEVDSQGGQVLADPIVELAGKLPALRFLELDQPS